MNPSKAMGDGHSAAAIARLNRLVDAKPAFHEMGKLNGRDVRFVLSLQEKAMGLADDALEELAAGEVGGDAQARYARALADVFEGWAKAGPGARRFLMGWAPFHRWASTAAGVVAGVPAEHPAMLALGRAPLSDGEREALRVPAAVERRMPRLGSSL